MKLKAGQSIKITFEAEVQDIGSNYIEFNPKYDWGNIVSLIDDDYDNAQIEIIEDVK